MNRLKYLVGALFFLILGYSGLWWTSAMGAAKSVEATFNRWASEGHAVKASDVAVSGFPYRIILDTKDVEITRKGKAILFRADKVTLISHLWTPRHWMGEAEGVKASVGAGRIAFTDGKIRGSWRQEDDGSEIIAIDSSGDTSDFSLVEAPYIETPTALANWLISARLHAPQADAATGLHEEKGTDFRITADGANGRLLLLGTASGTPPEGWSKKDLAGWGNAGGLIDFSEIDLTIPKGRIQGSGSITLDENAMPLGSFSLKVTDGRNAAAALADAGLLMKGAENAFANQPGTKPVSVMLQGGDISADGVLVGKMTPIAK